jgi:hypothetical protein
LPNLFKYASALVSARASLKTLKLLFNLLTGCQPFRRHSVTTLEDQILGKRIEFECIENKDLRMLCSGMLERSAEHRYNAERALKWANEIKSKMKSCE